MLYGAMNFPVRPVLVELEVLSGLGFDYLELAMDPPQAHYRVIREKKVELLKALDRHTMRVVCHLPTFVSTADLTDRLRETSLVEVLDSLEIAAELKPLKVVLHPSTVQPAVEAGIPTAFARTSLVLAASGGSFPRMALPFKLGVGGPIGSGRQWWSWISLRDEVRALHHIMEHTITGPVNLSSPQPILNKEFARELGSAMGRPSLLPAPVFGLHLLLGSEFADQVLLASQRVVPTVLTGTGFEFLDGDLASALRRITGRA